MHIALVRDPSLGTPFRHDTPGLQASEALKADYPLHEGTFFGDVFAARPVGYVCGPRHDQGMRERLQAQRRLCALPLQAGVSPAPTACGFTYVGECTPGAFVQQGVRYEQAISVRLKDGSPPSSRVD